MLKKLWTRLKIRLFVSRKVTLGTQFQIGMLSYVSCPSSLSIGDQVYVGKFCTIQCNGAIGNGVLIANNVGVVGRRDHDYRDIGKPMSRVAWVGNSDYLANHPANAVDIGDDVWIGFGTCILTGIKIGRGSVIAAGSVVVEDVEPYAIVAGNPAKFMRMRMTEAEIIEHELQLAIRYPKK